MYKDKDGQREANAERQRRYKAKQKALLSEGVTDKALPKDERLTEAECLQSHVEIKLKSVPPKPKRGKDIKCFAGLPPDVQQTIDMMGTVDGKIDQTIKANRTAIAVNYQHLFPDKYEPMSLPSCCQLTESEREGYNPASELKPGEYNHVSKPGDDDYNGICTPEWRAERGR